MNDLLKLITSIPIPSISTLIIWYGIAFLFGLLYLNFFRGLYYGLYNNAIYSYWHLNLYLLVSLSIITYNDYHINYGYVFCYSILFLFSIYNFLFFLDKQNLDYYLYLQDRLFPNHLNDSIEVPILVLVPIYLYFYMYIHMFTLEDYNTTTYCKFPYRNSYSDEFDKTFFSRNPWIFFLKEFSLVGSLLFFHEQFFQYIDFSIFFFFLPSEIFIIYKPLDWYLRLPYSIYRTLSGEELSMYLLISSIIVLFMLPFTTQFGEKNLIQKSHNHVFFILFVISSLLLIWLGCVPMVILKKGGLIILHYICVGYYFLYFFFILTWISLIDDDRNFLGCF